MKTLCGTPQYVAPEILFRMQGKQDSYSKAVDLWSLGVILYILLSGSPPFYEKKDNRAWMREQIQTGQFTFPKKLFKDVSSDAIDLIKQLLTVDPATRITINQTKEHPWIKSYFDNEDKKDGSHSTGNLNNNGTQASDNEDINTSELSSVISDDSAAAVTSEGSADSSKRKYKRKNSKSTTSSSDISSPEISERKSSLRKRKTSETPEPVTQTPKKKKKVIV